MAKDLYISVCQARACLRRLLTNGPDDSCQMVSRMQLINAGREGPSVCSSYSRPFMTDRGRCAICREASSIGDASEDSALTAL